MKKYLKDNKTYIETNPEIENEIFDGALNAGFFVHENNSEYCVLYWDYQFSQEIDNVTKHYFMNTSNNYKSALMGEKDDDDYSGLYGTLKQVVWTVLSK